LRLRGEDWTHETRGTKLFEKWGRNTTDLPTRDLIWPAIYGVVLNGIGSSGVDRKHSGKCWQRSCLLPSLNKTLRDADDAFQLSDSQCHYSPAFLVFPRLHHRIMKK